MRGLGQNDGFDLSFKVSSVTLFGLNLQSVFFFLTLITGKKSA